MDEARRGEDGKKEREREREGGGGGHCWGGKQEEIAKRKSGNSYLK